MAFWNWSHTASSNATADSTVNWAEGMAPSAVNDSARAMMARLAEWRDDISGSLTTGGTSSAYTLTTNEGLAAPTPTTGQLAAFVANATNALGATLAVDGGSAYPLQATPGASIGAGILVAGSPYTAMFSGTAWLLRNFFGNPFNTPVGGLFPYLGSSAPNSNFVLPFGQAISRTTYATLFALISTTFGPGDGLTTFNIPDLRGRGVFGLDNMGGSAAGRISVAGGNFDGTVLGNTGGGQNHTLTTTEIPTHNHGITDPGHAHSISISAQVTGGTPGVTVFAGGGTSNTNGATTGISINNAGGGAAHTILSPAMTLPYILRVI